MCIRDRLKKDGLEEMVIAKTGLIPDAYFSASKIAWILENVDGARELANQNKLLFGTVDTWLIYNLTGGKIHVTDYTNASRTMLFDIHQLCWDDELLAYFKIPKSMLPEVKPSSCVYGYTKEGILGGHIPVCMKEFGYSSVMQCPKLTKIVINQGMGQAVADKKLIDVAEAELTHIALKDVRNSLASIFLKVFGFWDKDYWVVIEK